MKTSVETVRTEDGSPMRLHVTRPAPGGRRPAVLVLQEAFGVNSHILNVNERVAELGYVAVAPELYHRTAPPGWTCSYSDFAQVKPHLEALTPEAVRFDLNAACEFLHADAGVDSGKLAAMGFCLGGRVAFLADAWLPLKGAVSFYGGRIPAWREQVKSMSGAPIALFWGGKDAHIPPEQRAEVRDILRGHGVDYVDIEFAAADHGFFCEQKSAYHPASARQAWALTTQFLTDCF